MSQSGGRENAPGASASSLEIRILDGVHAGAVVSIDAGQTVSLGSAPTNDLILRDAPFSSARLTTYEDGWGWIEDDAAVGRHEFGIGRGIRAAGLSLAVVDPASPWLTGRNAIVDYERPNTAAAPTSSDPEVATAPTIMTGAGSDAAGDAMSDPAASGPDVAPSRETGEPLAEASAGVARDASGRHTPGSSPGAGRINWRRAGWLAPGALMVGLAGFAGHSLYQSIGRDKEQPRLATEAQPGAARASREDLRRIEGLLASVGFNDVVKASLRADGRIDVVGVLENVDEQDQVMRLLAPERRLLSLRLLSPPEFAARVLEVGRSLPPGLVATALPGAGVLLSGLALGGAEARVAQRMLSEALPELMSVTVRVTQPSDVAVLLEAQLREKGLGEIAVNWSGSHIVVDGKIPRSAEGTLAAALLGFTTGYGDRLPARVSLALIDPALPLVPIAESASVPPPLRLPKIVAIQSGSLSYLLFADGTRVLPGGVVNGYRLAAIDDDALLFEDRDGNQHRVPR